MATPMERRVVREITHNGNKMNTKRIEQLKGKIISEGTLKHDDLCIAFLNVLAFVESEKHKPLLNRFKKCTRINDDQIRNDEIADLLMGDLLEAVEECAPEGYYFSSHEGNGACFGFWKCQDE